MTSSRRYRILMFAPAFAPFGNPEAIVNSKLALAFIEAGWEIDVVSRNCNDESSYNYGSLWIEPWLPLRERTHIVSYPRGSTVCRAFDTLLSAVNIGHPIEGCRWAQHAFRLACALHQRKAYDVILSRALPDSGHLPALAFSKTFAIPWVANWNDATGPKNPPPAGQGPTAPLGFIYERFLGAVARGASWHTFPSDRMRNHICSYLKEETPAKSSTVPHVGLDDSPAVLHNGSDLGHCFTLCYAGNLYAGRNPDLFLKAFKKFIIAAGCGRTTRLIFIGLEDIGLLRLVQQLDLNENVRVLGPLSYRETLDHFTSSDVLVVLEAPYTDGIYLPSKFVDYVQVGKPVFAVGPANGTLNDLLTRHGGGVAADCTSESQIAMRLLELYSCWHKGELGLRYSTRSLHHLFSPRSIVEKYREIFAIISAGSRA